MTACISRGEARPRCRKCIPYQLGECNRSRLHGGKAVSRLTRTTTGVRRSTPGQPCRKFSIITGMRRPEAPAHRRPNMAGSLIVAVLRTDRPLADHRAKRKQRAGESIAMTPLPMNSLTVALRTTSITQRSDYRTIALCAPFVRQENIPRQLDRPSYRQRCSDQLLQQHLIQSAWHQLFCRRENLENEALPSFDATTAVVRIPANFPLQRRLHGTMPKWYHSFRHLHLSGMENLRIDPDEQASDSPLPRKKMERQTGMICKSSRELSTMIVDLQKKDRRNSRRPATVRFVVHQQRNLR